ncbi:MAG TPA: hypothetical protein VGB95_00645 [Chitinophagales bacterium]
MKKPLFFVLSCLPVSGLAIFPFIIVKHRDLKNNQRLVYHERIHFAQQKELLFVFFFALYLLNYLGNLLRFRNHEKAYREICFEREAYENDTLRHYLRNRKLFAFLNYL